MSDSKDPQHDKMDTEPDVVTEDPQPSPSASEVVAMDCEATTPSTSATSTTNNKNQTETTTSTSNNTAPKSANKKAELQQKFKKLHLQLIKGCGRFNCSNPDCGSNSARTAKPLSKAESVKVALEALKNPNAKICQPIQPITLSHVHELVSAAEKSGDASKIIRFCYSTFSDPDVLDQSFRFEMDEKRKHGDGIATENSSEIDFKALDEAYEMLVLNDELADETSQSIQSSIGNAINQLSNFFSFGSGPKEPHELRKYVILLLNPMFNLFENYSAFKKVCKGIAAITEEKRNILVTWFSGFDEVRFENLLDMLQQYITLSWISKGHESAYKEVAPAVCVMGILHKANKTTHYHPFSAFYNDAVNLKYKYFATVDYERKYGYRQRTKDFSFVDYDFILDAAAKSQLLQIDATVQMNKEFRQAEVQRFFNPAAGRGYLFLKIKRDQLINDALNQLDHRDSRELKRPLKVKFDGEDGVDEGGVQKEFFQLVIRQLFLPEYGMFEHMEHTRLYWFNKDALDGAAEFRLIGKVIGLAVYNGVILDIHFPKVVFKKLIDTNYAATINDVAEFQPDVADNFKKLLTFEGDVENTFCLNFAIEYLLFGEKKVVELKEDGANIPLTKENREEYIDLYVDYIINKSVTKQFEAFYSGFHDVCGGEYFEKFNWEELILLVCGSDDLDFDKLQEAARYEDGFEESSETIKNFWIVIHELDEENKKKFLFFCTGSDRVPIRGLGDLIITISKNGQDNSRLPTAHTCFNHLLLPEYPTKSILKERLLKAIQNSEGFGLL